MAALAFCTAPVPGDIGGCGQPVQELDPEIFFSAKRFIDCERCAECGFPTAACSAACDRELPTATEFPERCLPLVHDGEVCLRVLLAASCADYESYVRDASPEVPTECNFCPPERQ